MADPILNALIFDYLNKKDKTLAQTFKLKVKAVSKPSISSRLS